MQQPDQTTFIDPFTLSPDERAATFNARMAYANSARLARHGTGDDQNSDYGDDRD